MTVIPKPRGSMRVPCANLTPLGVHWLIQWTKIKNDARNLWAPKLKGFLVLKGFCGGVVCTHYYLRCILVLLGSTEIDDDDSGNS